jgi:branched-chain amino acid transport system substrate-binding protein
MKFKPYLLSVLLIFTVTAGCNPDESSSDQAGAQADTSATLQVGALLPLTGPGGVFADYIKKGLDLAVEEVNSGSGNKVNLMYRDSENKPQVGVSAFKQMMLTEDPPVTITALSSVTKAVGPLAKKNETVTIGTAVGLPDVTSPSNYVFRVYPRAQGISGVIADYAIEKYETVGVAYINDAFGRSSAEVFKEKFEEQGGEVPLMEPYELTESDFRNQWGRFKQANLDAVWIVGYGPAYSTLVTQMREVGVGADLLADMTLGLPVTLKNVGDAAEGVVYVDARLDSSFVKQFREKYGERPTNYAGYAYDIVMMLNKVRKQHGTSPEAIRDGFAQIENYDGVTGNITIDEKRNASLEFVLMQIQNGKPTLFRGKSEGQPAP